MSDAEAQEFYFRPSSGIDLWASISGSGPAFVLCDGLGCDGFIWKYLKPQLEEHFKVIHWHYRGHGQSEPAETAEGYGPTPFANDLVELLDEHADGPAILAGHSMGVQVILETWWQLKQAGREDALSALIPLAGAAGRPLDTFKGTNLGRMALPLILQLLERYPRMIRNQWRRWVPSKLTHLIAERTEINNRLMPISDLAPYFDRLSKMDPEIFFQTLAGAADHDMSDVLGQCQVPALVVAAELDSFTPMSRSLEMASSMPLAELFVLPQATHTGPLEWPDLLWLRLRKFLRTNGLLREPEQTGTIEP